MKKSCTLLVSAIAIAITTGFAQPVLTSSLTTVPLGTIDTAYGASPTVLPGSGGAGVAWDMSTVPTVYAAKLTTIDPATSPYTSTFSTANFCVKVEGTTTSYNYNRQSAKGLEFMAQTYAGTGTGTDYSLNPRLAVSFPFNYGDTKSDTFQTATSGPDTVRLTYDGYGSLKTPFNTFSNVVRVKEEYGTSTSYSWYTVSPFALVMNYSSASNNYVIVKSHFVTTEVKNITAAAQPIVYPNPTSGDATLLLDLAAYDNASIAITDIAGKVVKQVPVTSSRTIIHKDALSSGLYFYTVHNGGRNIANGKLVIN